MAAAPTLETLADDLTAGRTTSRALTEACLAAIAAPAGEGRLAFVAVDPDAALAQAGRIDAARAQGAAPSRYAGIPVSIKDLFDVAGEVTRAGSIALADRAPATDDAVSVARLRAAGFVLIGRTNMSEFAFSGIGLNPHYGTPANPWDRVSRRVPGGSTSGGAVSVADGMAHAALGTDTGGSCRIPAAFSGLVGFKPTARRVPLDGGIPLSVSLDSIGPIGRSVQCCATLDAILADETSTLLADVELRGLRFAVPRNFVMAGIEAPIAAFERSLTRLSATGAAIDEIDIPSFDDLPMINAKGGFAASESYAWHRPLLAERGSYYDPQIRVRIERGAGQSAADYIDLLAARRHFIAAVGAILDGYDAMLMPTVPIVAPCIADLADNDAFATANLLALRNPAVINFLDGCAISVPMHRPGEPPAGLMIAGIGGADRAVLQIAQAIASALDD